LKERRRIEKEEGGGAGCTWVPGGGDVGGKGELTRREEKEGRGSEGHEKKVNRGAGEGRGWGCAVAKKKREDVEEKKKEREVQGSSA